MHSIIKPIAAGLLAALAGPAGAAAEGEHREHDAHVHGVAHLNIAVENGRIDAELESPAMNLVGFEHAPRDAGQREAVARAAALLEDGAARLVPSPAATCRLESAEVTSSLLEAGPGHGEHEEHGHEEHDEHKEHGHEEHTEHDEHGHDEHGHDTARDDVHSELHVHYRFQCDAPEALEAIQVNLFEPFPGMEEIELQVLTATHQIGGVLTPDENRIDLSR